MAKSGKSLPFLKSLLFIQVAILMVYTIIVLNNHGLTLFEVMINNIYSLDWNGQFNLDFACYLMLSGIWIIWRNKFATNAIILAAIAMIMGIIVFASYVLYLVISEQGDIKKVLLGKQ